MSQRSCRECHHLVSEEAKTCPYCGISRPGTTDGSDGWFGRHRGAFLLAVILLSLEVAWFRHQVGLLSGPPPPTFPRAAPDTAFLQEPERTPRVIQVQVLDSTTGRPLLRTVMWELRWSKDGHASVARPARADTTNGVLRLDSVVTPQVQIQCVSKRGRFKGHFIAELDTAQMARASGGDTLQLWIDGEPCDRRELVEEYGSWTGHYIPGFESSDFRICDDTARKIWAEFAPGFWDRPQEDWPEGGDQYYPRYFVRFRGRLVGPYSYGHLGVSDYELTVDSIAFVRLAASRDCERGGTHR